MIDTIKKDSSDRMQKSVEATVRELGAVRTGKASVHILDNIKVETYGSVMPLIQVATATAPEPRLIVVNAFDKTTVPAIVKAIQKADLGLNPLVEGQTIRLPVPALNEERRLQLIKHCKTVAEDGRIAVRNIRRDANEQIKKAEKNKELSEDQEQDGHDEIQKMTDEHIKKIDEFLEKREKDLLEV